MTVVAVDPREGAVQGAPDIGGVEDDVGGLATEFERDGFQVAPGGGGDHPSGGGAAGEPHHVDPGMRHQGIPGHCAAPVHEIDHARRQAGLVQHFDQSSDRKRGVFRGFEHTGVAPGDARSDAHRGQRERCVPGCDARCDTLGFAGDIGQVPRGLGIGLPVRGTGDFGKEFKVPCHPLDLVPHAEQRQPDAGALEPGQFLRIATQVVPDRVQDVFTGVDVEPRPRTAVEGETGRLHRGIHLCRISLAERAEWLFGGRIDDLDVMTGRLGRHGHPIDQARDPRRDRVRVQSVVCGHCGLHAGGGGGGGGAQALADDEPACHHETITSAGPS